MPRRDPDPRERSTSGAPDVEAYGLGGERSYQFAVLVFPRVESGQRVGRPKLSDSLPFNRIY